MLKENTEKLKTATSDEEIKELQKRYSVLKRVNMEISKALGERTIY